MVVGRPGNQDYEEERHYRGGDGRTAADVTGGKCSAHTPYSAGIQLEYPQVRAQKQKPRPKPGHWLEGRGCYHFCSLYASHLFSQAKPMKNPPTLPIVSPNTQDQNWPLVMPPG